MNRIIDIINRHRSFLIASHVRLDGDALGSELALYQMLLNMGKDVIVYNQDETPGNYRFLPGSDKIVHRLPPLNKCEAVFILDCSEFERIGDEAARIGGMERIINIDHHVSNRNFGSIVIVDHSASSTAELLYSIMVKMGADITRDMATNLYAAIITDTGGFCYGNTRKDTLIAAGNLVGKGADPQWISENVYETNPLSKIRLLTKVLETLSFDWDRKVGYMVVYRKDFKDVGALMEHTEGFVDIPRSIEGVEVSILFTEMSDNQFKLSLRSKGKANVERVAAAFGGGGHINAAACHIDGDFETVLRKVLEAISSSQQISG
ncbi:MAG TPA: bifunctional oligoribonuclease/PAP phosphatase NrnA [Syntrophales bacterium]|nr:bifunctional oligoribonuclease/PAP phosphatase NrnA [Syntrophales bacterium]